MGLTNEYDANGAGMYRLEDGQLLDSMMAVGQSPWHYTYNQDMINLLDEGTKVTSKEINKVAGLDWSVSQVPLNDVLVGGYNALPSDIVNVRDDLGLIIGQVKKRYRVFQNAEAPRFLDSLVDSGDACYETAGSLFAGKQVWWLMKLPEGVTVGGDAREKLETYILFTNSHDGSSAVAVSIVTIRVVCQNTLSWALRSALRQIKIRHTDSAKEQWAQARTSLAIGYNYQAEMAQTADQMLQVSFSNDEFQAFLDDLIPTPTPVEGKKDGKTVITNQRGISIAENQKSAIKVINLNNPTQVHIQGTLWGAVQAVSYYTDHEGFGRDTSANGGGTVEENRFKRLVSGATLSAKAFDKALALV